jgi:hypothetical protein
MRDLISQGVWAVPGLSLLIVAWVKFNSPPTNRSGTTFALFYSGVLFYYALLVSLWLLVIVLLHGSGSGLDWLGHLLDKDPQAREQIGRFAPVVAALIVVVASLFPEVHRFDVGARSFCIKLASIPREADYLGMELAQNAQFNPPNDRLRRLVADTIRENIGENALNFSNDGSMAARFTRAVSLYSLFILPDGNGMALEFPAKAHARSAYAKIMRLSEKTVAQAHARYEALMESALAYFTSAKPTRAMKEALKITIKELSVLVCSLIARYVLYLDRTSGQRRNRLSNMGFDTPHVVHTFGSDQWVASILLVAILSLLIISVTGNVGGPGEALVITMTFAISIGIATVMGTFVAQRFIQRDEGVGVQFPPLAELTLAGLIIVGISIALRIGFPLIPAFLTSGSFALQDSVKAFAERWPVVLVPLVCTFSIGLLCSYLGRLDLSWPRLAFAGAVGNGLAFAFAGLLMLPFLDERLLIQRFADPDRARPIIVASLCVIGAVLGAMVLATFRRSMRAAQASTAMGLPPETKIFSAAGIVDNIQSTSAEVAAIPRAPKDFGGYLREAVEELEGKYVCFRPTFGNPQIINAYITVIRWDEKRSCLVFEEQSRADSGYVQTGRVYIPDGKPFINLVTAERGAVRLIMVSRPSDNGYARGVVMTLANSRGVHFTPASAPVVLTRVGDETPHLGFVHPGSPGYETYQSELAAVMPDYGLFAEAPKPPDNSRAAAENAVGTRLAAVS